MPSAHQFATVGQNRLLTLLPEDQRVSLETHLEEVEMGLKETVYLPNEPITHIYFPLSGVFSILTLLEDGSSMEVATVGNEGMVGIPVLLGADSTPGQGFAQVPGRALRMTAGSFRDVVAQDGELTRVLNRYVQGMFTQISQTAACNRAHTIERRCARWLLMTHDRVGGDKFPLTQEFLSQMLGVRRASVGEVAGALQATGLISYARGIITILDRAGLENASCECYVVIRDEYNRLLSVGPPNP